MAAKMFSKLAFNQLKGILGEIFEDVDENTLEISMLGDLFSESHVELSDLYLKQDIINDLLPPFNITRAFIGKLSVRGISEFLAGGDLTVIVDSVGLLLGPATAGADPDRVVRGRQLLLKIVELFANPYKDDLLKKVLARVYRRRTMTTSPRPKKVSKAAEDVKAAAIKFVMRGVAVDVRRIHVRWETPPPSGTPRPRGLTGGTV